MQKFKVKFQNSPMDAPQVYSSENLSLNRDQSLSEADKVLALNNLEVDLLQHKGGQGLRAVSATTNQPWLVNLIAGITAGFGATGIHETLKSVRGKNI